MLFFPNKIIQDSNNFYSTNLEYVFNDSDGHTLKVRQTWNVLIGQVVKHLASWPPAQQNTQFHGWDGGVGGPTYNVITANLSGG